MRALAFFLMITACLGAFQAQAAAWNDKAIVWHDYAEGVVLANHSGKPMVVIFYAEGCPACRALASWFEREDMQASVKDFIMIRVDADRAPDLAAIYAPDGDYLPRIFVLHANGDVMYPAYPKRAERFFGAAGDASVLIGLLERARRLSTSAAPAGR